MKQTNKHGLRELIAEMLVEQFEHGEISYYDDAGEILSLIKKEVLKQLNLVEHLEFHDIDMNDTVFIKKGELKQSLTKLFK